MLLGLFVTGCRSSEPFDKITRAATPEAFNYVAPLSSRAASTVYNDAGYYIVFDDENKVASVTISNLRVPGYDQPRTLTFVDVPMDYTSNNHMVERMIKAESLVSHDPINGGTEITDVTIVYIQSNSLDPNPTDGIYARFVIDGAYLVTAYPYDVFGEGTTRIDDLENLTTAYDYNTTYHLTLDPSTMTADMEVANLSVGGWKGNVTVKGLKLTLVDDGYEVEFGPSTSVDAEIPLEIDRFSGVADLRKRLDIDFDLRAQGVGEFRIASFLTPVLSLE